MKISLIIPTHNRADALDLTLTHLAKQEFSGAWEVIVVNNRSTDDTDRVVCGRPFPVSLRLVHQESGSGPAVARNAGARVATGEYLIFIDNDILVNPDFLQRHLQALNSHPGYWIVGQVVNLPEQEQTPFGQFRKTLFPFIPPDEPVRETDAITGQTMSLPRADFESLGGFDENFFVASGEDRELLFRANHRGKKMLLDPSIVVLHNDWAGTTIQDFCQRHRLYTQTEPLFWRKYGDDYPRQELVRENSPPDWHADSISLVLRKRMKQLLGSRLGQTVIISASVVCERVLPWPPLLWPLYKLAVSGAMYKGFQEGLALYNGDSE